MAVPATICGKVRIGSSDFAHITKWSFNIDADTQVYNSSSSAYHQLTLPGHFKGEISFDCIWDPADDIYDRVHIGDQVTLLLYVDGTRFWSVPARITAMNNDVEVATGSPPTVACTAQSHGAWTYPDGTVSALTCP